MPARETQPLHHVRIRHDVYMRLVKEAEYRDRTVTNLVNTILEDHYMMDPSPSQRGRALPAYGTRKMGE